MGMHKYEISLIKKSLDFINLDFENCVLAELGNQRIRFSPFGSSKSYLSSLGVKHESFDWNGFDDVKVINLAIPYEDKKFIEKYNVVTNFGTSEHVYDQYWCFWNIDNLCSIGGMMIHNIPLKDNWSGHCDYWYNLDFFKNLSKIYEYNLVSLEIDSSRGPGKHSVSCILNKTKKNKHMTEEKFKICLIEIYKCIPVQLLL